jgi:hypothetical protein
MYVLKLVSFTFIYVKDGKKKKNLFDKTFFFIYLWIGVKMRLRLTVIG